LLDPARSAAEAIWQLEANIDDMNPELCAHAAEAAFAAGALDVWWTPITMKKGRPALLVSALAPAAVRAAVAAALLRETTTLGVRFHPVERTIAVRFTEDVDTEFGPITMKVGHLDRAEINAAPEYESCRAAAEVAGVPLKVVYAAAIGAWERRRR